MGPAAVVAEVRRAVRAALRGNPVLVACSGGADSLALAAATAFEASRAGVRAGLVTVDHGLQPGSAAQAALVAGLGRELGLDPVLTVDVAVGSAGGPEAAARAARYAALAEVAKGLGADVMLGHTLDDQAETVLLGLGRGSGPRSITGMAAVDGRYLRPLLGVRRATTVAACAELGLTPWADPHNTDPRFQRVRVRTEVLPLLDDVLRGGAAPALARTADLLRDDLEALDAWAADVLAAATGAPPATPTAPLGDQLRDPAATLGDQLRDPAAPLGDQLRIPVAEPRGSAVDHQGGDHQGGDHQGGGHQGGGHQGGGHQGGGHQGGGHQGGGHQGGGDGADGLAVASITDLPRAVRTRVLRAWAVRAGSAPLSAERTAALDALVIDWHGQGPVPLPGGIAVVRASGRLEAKPGVRSQE